MNKNLDLILSLKSENPFVSLLFSFAIIGCYLLIVGLFIFVDDSFHNKIGFSIFLFLFFYFVSLLFGIHFIYSSFRYRQVDIYDNNVIFLNSKHVYSNITVEYISAPKGLFSYLRFYSNEKFVASFYLSSTYNIIDVPSEFILNLFNDKISDKKAYLAHSLEKYRKDMKKNGKLLLKGFVIVLLILAIPALIVFKFIR